MKIIDLDLDQIEQNENSRVNIMPLSDDVMLTKTM